MEGPGLLPLKSLLNKRSPVLTFRHCGRVFYMQLETTLLGHGAESAGIGPVDLYWAEELTTGSKVRHRMSKIFGVDQIFCCLWRQHKMILFLSGKRRERKGKKRERMGERGGKGKECQESCNFKQVRLARQIFEGVAGIFECQPKAIGRKKSPRQENAWCV